MLHEGSELEPDRLVDIQGSGQIFFVEAVILGAELLFVYSADLYQELAPGVLAVAGQQGVVQIEERQCHVATLYKRMGAGGSHRRRWRRLSRPRWAPEEQRQARRGLLR